MHEVDAAVIAALKRLITPEVTRDVILELRGGLHERLRKAPVEAEELTAESAKLKREINRLTDARGLAAPLAQISQQPRSAQHEPRRPENTLLHRVVRNHAPPPSDHSIAQLLVTIRKRILRHLARCASAQEE